MQAHPFYNARYVGDIASVPQRTRHRHTHQPLHLFKSLKPQTVCCCPDPFLSYNSWRASGGHRSRKRPAESKTSFPFHFYRTIRGGHRSRNQCVQWRASFPIHFYRTIRGGHRSRCGRIAKRASLPIHFYRTIRCGHLSRCVAGIAPDPFLSHGWLPGRATASTSQWKIFW